MNDSNDYGKGKNDLFLNRHCWQAGREHYFVENRFKTDNPKDLYKILTVISLKRRDIRSEK